MFDLFKFEKHVSLVFRLFHREWTHRLNRLFQMYKYTDSRCSEMLGDKCSDKRSDAEVLGQMFGQAFGR